MKLQSLEISTWTDLFEDKVNIPELTDYLKFIKSAVESFDPDRYSERHHVLPRCIDHDKMFTLETVRINGHDHFTAHLKLINCFIDSFFKYKLTSALSYMSGKTISRLHEITPDEYEELRRVRSENSKGECNPAKRPEVQRKMSLNHADFSGKNHPMYGVSRSGSDNPFYGKTHTSETRRKISETRISRGVSSGENNPMYGVRLCGGSNGMYGRTHRSDSVKKMSDLKKGSGNPVYGKFCINDGKVNRYIPRGDDIPEGWVKGKILKKFSEKESKS